MYVPTFVTIHPRDVEIFESNNNGFNPEVQKRMEYNNIGHFLLNEIAQMENCGISHYCTVFALLKS